MAAYFPQIDRWQRYDNLDGGDQRSLVTGSPAPKLAAMVRCPSCATDNAPGTKFCRECGTRLDVAPSREVRKIVTVLFSDIAGSTALGERLEPESVRAVMTRCFQEIRAILERHGGTVEKFIGDAVMAVFGVPVLHEDDALRAVRAAGEIRDRVAQLSVELTAERDVSLALRTGVHTGEVVAGDPAGGETLVTGDAVNTAARLEQAAAPGEILIGLPTYRLVRDAVSAEQTAPIDAKGKAEPVPAYRLIDVRPGLAASTRPSTAPLAGRDRELATLRDSYDRAENREPQLVTVLGTAGVGKSRLITEFVTALGPGATILTGRCLPYGDGITYWPLREIVHSVAGIVDDDSSAGARAKLAALFAGTSDAVLLAHRIGAAIGLEQDAAPQEEVFWATRRLLEQLALARPLVLIWEDIHWAAETLLDLLEYLADLATDLPLLILCSARLEVLERRSGWGGGRSNSTIIRVEPLADVATAGLIRVLPGGSALPSDLQDRIVAAAEGNPLYVEEMLAMLLDDGYLNHVGGRWVASGELERAPVPPSVRALLAARIDALPEEERTVAERASVVGRVFEAAAVRELAGDVGDSVARALLALVRKELLRPERSELSAGDAFKFRHLLIRDAAYEALPKSERADLHERFAAWVERTAADRVTEYEEIIGYHLERAYRYRRDLDPRDDALAGLAAAAAERLARAGRRAVTRADGAAATLLGRAAELIPADSAARSAIVLDYASALASDGRFAEAGDTLRPVVAGLEPDSPLGLRARLLDLQATVFAGGGASFEEMSATTLVLLERLEMQSERPGLAHAWRMFAFGEWGRGRVGRAGEAMKRALRVARETGESGEEADAQRYLCLFGVFGPMALTEARVVCEEVLGSPLGGPTTTALAQVSLGAVEAMSGALDDGRSRIDLGLSVARDVGNVIWLAGSQQIGALVELEAGHASQASVTLAEASEALARVGETAYRSTVEALRAECLFRLGRHDEALETALGAQRLGSDDDVATQALGLAVQAEVLAHRDRASAVELGDAAGRIVADTEYPFLKGIVGLARARVARVVGDVPQAERLLDTAIHEYVMKGDVLAVDTIRVDPWLTSARYSE